MCSKIRLFYALMPDKDTRLRISTFQQTLLGKKTPPEKLHITLAFLGLQEKKLITELSALLYTFPQELLKTFSFPLDHFGYFPKTKISWIGMQSPPIHFLSFRTALAKQLQEKNIVFDNKNKFTPHITLTRNSPPPKQKHKIMPSIAWETASLALIQSSVSKDPAYPHSVYTTIAEHLL